MSGPTGTPEPVRPRVDAAQDPVALLDGVPLTDDEAGYVEAARAANTLRGYRSDWREFTSWCTQHDLQPLPAAPPTITGYVSELARHGAKVGGQVDALIQQRRPGLGDGLVAEPSARSAAG